MSKEEKIKLLEEKRAKFRAQKIKNEANEKFERAKKDREAIKAQADMQRKREAHQNKMAIEFKKKQKADNKRRKAAAREKIRNSPFFSFIRSLKIVSLHVIIVLRLLI